jgi:hypothetical protein
LTDKTRAWVPHRKVVEEKLGREAKLADLAKFLLCPACGLELRSFKDQLADAEKFRAFTFRFDSVERNMFEDEQDEAERRARRKECRATLAALAGVKVTLDEDEDGAILTIAPVTSIVDAGKKKAAEG